MTSAEDAIRARRADEQANLERQRREFRARQIQLWKELQAEAGPAIRRLEAKNWPNGQLATITTTPEPTGRRRTSKTPTRTELAVWVLGSVHHYRGIHEYEIVLRLGSDGMIYFGKDSHAAQLTKAMSPHDDWSIPGSLEYCLRVMKELGR